MPVKQSREHSEDVEMADEQKAEDNADDMAEDIGSSGETQTQTDAEPYLAEMARNLRERLANESVEDICEDSKLMDDNNIVAIVLSAYNTSLSKTDQQLLQLLSCLEKNGKNLYRYQPFMWGMKGAVHYSADGKGKDALLKEPKMEEILSLIDGSRLKNTLDNFPIDIPLTPIEVIDVEYGDQLTDPRFLLPLFYHLLSSQSLVKCHRFVSFGCMSYAIACLSSQWPDVRSLAYCVLSRFHSHLESATFPNDRFLWIAIIDCIRAGLTSENCRMKSVIAVYIIRIIDILLHPNDKLYEKVKRYLWNRPTINFNVLPDFYSHLYSSDIETHQRLQHFVISWIRDGIRTEDDIKICLKRNVFSELMTLFDSELSDGYNRPLILTVLKRTCAHYYGAKVLATEKGLFCWLKQTVDNFADDMLVVDEIFKIVETVWKTIVSTESAHCLYPSFNYEVIDVLKSIVELNPSYDKHSILASDVLPPNGITGRTTCLTTQISNYLLQNI